MYTFDAIILDIFHIQDKKYRLILFSREFGRISAWWYKSLSGVDIGDIAQIVIERKETINRIKSIHTRHFLIQKEWTYESLFQFLHTLSVLKNCIHDGESYPRIFDDYAHIVKTLSCLSQNQCLLFEMRILRQLGYLDPSFYQHDSILAYIYQNINSSPLQKILQAKPLKAEHAHIIHTSHLHALSFLTQ